ncbi:MAG: hypothetical protein AAGA54_03330 [Myxococcota bacterium]
MAKRSFKVSRLALVGLALAIGAAASSVRGELAQVRGRMPDDVEVLYVPEAQYLRPMSVGYREALGDLLWVRALIFSGASIGHTDVAAVGRYADAISGLSPRFHRVYQWGGVTAVYGGGATVTREMVDIAVGVYRDGLAQYPESHILLYGLGMMLSHQVSSTPGYTEAEKDAAREEGVELIRRAAAFGADPLVRQYAATLVSEHATGTLARQFLEAELAQAEDPDYQRMLRKKLREMGAASSVESVERVRATFVADQRQRGAYVPDALYVLLRDEAAAPVEVPAPRPAAFDD